MSEGNLEDDLEEVKTRLESAERDSRENFDVIRKVIDCATRCGDHKTFRECMERIR